MVARNPLVQNGANPPVRHWQCRVGTDRHQNRSDPQGILATTAHAVREALGWLKAAFRIPFDGGSKWLKAGVMEDGEVTRLEVGTPQGGVSTP